MLCALDMRVHGTHLVYKVKCPCRGLHTLGMSLSVVAQLHCIGVRQITISHRCVHGTDLALRLVLNCVGSRMEQSPIESHIVK